MSDFVPGLEGVVAFETAIAEPDREGGSLRYRGVDIDDLVGQVSFGHVWGLLVDDKFAPGLPPAEPYPIPVHSGDIRVDVQSALAMLAPAWGLRPAARHQRRAGPRRPRPDLGDGAVVRRPVGPRARPAGGPAGTDGRGVDTIVERFMIRWRGEPTRGTSRPIDAYWVSAAEHGMNASTFTARVVASTGADVAACARPARSARCPARCTAARPPGCCTMIEEVERTGDAARLREAGAGPRRPADGLRSPGVPGRGPARPGAAPHRQELNAPAYEVAAALEQAALAELQARRPDRVLATNVEFWAAVVLDFAEVPAAHVHRRCSPAPGPPAGARTSSSRSGPGG